MQETGNRDNSRKRGGTGNPGDTESIGKTGRVGSAESTGRVGGAGSTRDIGNCGSSGSIERTESIGSIARVTLVGSGNLAEALARALAREGLLTQICARNAGRGRELAARHGVGWVGDVTEIRATDCVLLAVSDRSIGAVARGLHLHPTTVVAHTSGAVDIGALGTHPRRGVFYPLQSFTKGREVDFGAVPLFVEGSDAATAEALTALARRIGGSVHAADSECRRRIHLAGVLANNFTNALYGWAVETVRRAGLPAEVLDALILETARKAVDAHDPARVQTGPAVRGDRLSQLRHLELLDDRHRELYELLSKLIWETSRKTLQEPGP